MRNEADGERATCCVVGAGPAGMVLALLLARQGIDVTLLEAHEDFDRDFRGDTLHASALETLDQIGLAERVLELGRSRLERAELITAEGTLEIAAFHRLRTRFPYVALIPQEDFLGLLAEHAKTLPSFRLLMGANVRELIVEDGVVQGVVYRRDGELHRLQADLVVGTDGRGSRVRRAAGLELVSGAPAMDVVWFRLPREPGDDALAGVALRVGHGELMVVFERGDHWQAGYVIVKGSFRELRKRGIEALRQEIAELVPAFADRVDSLESWSDVAVLAVETGCLRRWHAPGLLLLGDAAHVMSPIGGVGINYAIQDAVAAANLLAGPLAEGCLEPSHLAAVERRRRWPTRFIQGIQSRIQKQIIASALRSDRPFRPPLALRLLARSRFSRALVAWVIAYGVRSERVELPDSVS